MANDYNSQPIQLDTDFTSWRENQTLVDQNSVALAGIRPFKITIVANKATTAGQLTFVSPSDSLSLYPPVEILSSQAAGTVLYTDNITSLLTWKDFSVSGLTATGVTAYIWYRN